jgi:microcompartment protein CcmL/EutN
MAVPAATSGSGQVEVMVQGRLAIVQACTRGAAALAPRTKVKVVDLLDRSTLLVEPLG